LIALDSSSLIAYLEGRSGRDVEAVEMALAERQGCLPPVVLTELSSDPKLPPRVRTLLSQLPLLDLTEGYWERAGSLRALVIARRMKAPLADTLIAQSCIDHDVALVARDADFVRFARLGGLRLAL
jgi:predicted nucleic acid-binding protein